ncbi:hypothetical protein GF374_00990 [Candidatus Woesearchaeota archaeon]|nr:hypothetical protein [Candidatus Woesearchaeota archaeon]
MKILAIGDLHGDLKQAKKLAEKAEKENVDLIILNGDFTLFEKHTPGLLQTFKDKGQKLLLLPGNHESPATVDFLAKKYGATNLHNYALSIKDIGIFGCGSANIGVFQLPEDEILNSLRKGHNQIKDSKKKIMITHVHPDKTLASKIGFIGSKGVKQAIDELKPDVALFAHIHEAEGIEETIGNTKIHCVGKKGKIIEV